jgi:vacuolar-type H+-ATPase subunit F/Vma7
MKKIKACAIGERDIIRIFGAYSFDLHPVNDSTAFNQKLYQLLKEEAMNIYIITETYIALLSKENTALINEIKPVILSIPTHKGSNSSTRGILSDLIRKAVGIDLLSNEKGVT